MADKRQQEPLRQTIFLEVSEELRREKDSSFLVDAVLRACKVAVKDVLCLQSFGQGLYDLSFHDAPVCAAALERLRAAAGRVEALRGIDFCLGSARRRVPVTVHAEDPFLSDGALVAFLRPFCETVSKGEKLYNSLGLWNGKRRFVAILKLENGAARPGDTLHPPAVFSIGACRGTLTYPGQPKYCGICSTSGHCKAECQKGICTYCGERGHEPHDCYRRDHEEFPWWEDMEDGGEVYGWVDNSCGGRG